MQNQQLLIFDDGQGQWGPMTDTRAVFDLRTGPQTTRQRIERAVGAAVGALIVPDELAEIYAQSNPGIAVNRRLHGETWLMINGRWPGVAAEQAVRELPIGTALVQNDGQVIAAHLERDDADRYFELGLIKLPQGVLVQPHEVNVLFDRPWQILDELDRTLRADLDSTELPQHDCPANDGVCFGDYPVHLATGVTLQPRVIFNTQQGPIVVEDGVLLGALAILEGPCYIGPSSQVACHAHIRPHTVVGPMCKVAGEISHSIIHGYSNKGHHGYLGHCLMGQWVNLGAGTNVSNLKNTYGQVRVQLDPDHDAQDTGRMYQGPIIGDYVRTGIGTRIVTGACISTGSMLATSRYTPKFVQRFSFMTDTSLETCDIEKFLTTARKMMARRGCVLSPPMEERLRALADQAAGQATEELFSQAWLGYEV